MNSYTFDEHSDPAIRKPPNDGHVILLWEQDEEKNTFSDYPDILNCLTTISDIYEKTRVAKGLVKDDYDLDNLCEWTKSFRKFTLFVYDGQIGRYKELNYTEMENMFRDGLSSDVMGLTVNGVSSQDEDQNENENNLINQDEDMDRIDYG